tara:strand:+ start:233 stop:583 length:351 start_codon:yes stop_codon:yes gene_type:complete
MKEKTYKLETAENHYSDRKYNVNICFPEFTCLCPRTGLPDFATIIIDYQPKDLLVELKSLKLYFLNYRNKGIFHEHVTNMILDDFKKSCKPFSIVVTAKFGTRGGIDTTVKSSWPN